MKSRRRQSTVDEDEEISGYRDNAREVESPDLERVGLLSRIALRMSAIEWGPYKRLGQLLLVVLPFVWPAALVPWFGWGIAGATSGFIVLVWILPGCIMGSYAPDSDGQIGTALRFAWWPFFSSARLYRWVRDGK